MMRWLLLPLLILSSMSAHAQERPASPVLMTMGPMDAESDNKSTAITVRYDSKPNFDRPKVEAMGSFLQVSLPNTLVSNPGQFVDAKSPYIRKFAAFQLDPQTAGLRLFVSKEASLLAPALSVDILENRVVIILDHIQVEKSLQPLSEITVPREKEIEPTQVVPAASQVVEHSSAQETVLNTKINELAKEDLGNEKKLDKKTQSQSIEEIAKSNVDDDMKEKMVMVTIFLAFMLLLLIGLKTWRRLMARKWPLTPTEDITVKTLATHPLGPKQKLTVVQVGQEQILLGVSPDSINFLSTLNRKPEAISRTSLEMPPISKPSMPPQKREVLEAAPLRKSAPKKVLATEEGPRSGGSISYGIGDDGIKNLKTTRSPQADQDSIEDVTKLIRKKLRELPKV